VEIEKEVMTIEDIAFSDDPVHPPIPANPYENEDHPGDSDATLTEKPGRPVLPSIRSHEKSSTDPEKTPALSFSTPSRTHFTVRPPPLRLIVRRIRRRLRALGRRALLTLFPWLDPRRRARNDPIGASCAGTTVRRMARTRRLVTSLSRALATKADVIARVQKRLLTQVHGEAVGMAAAASASGDALGALAGAISPGSRGGERGREHRGEAAEVAIYYGDVQGACVCLKPSQ
jgi:magnesium transporter